MPSNPSNRSRAALTGAALALSWALAHAHAGRRPGVESSVREALAVARVAAAVPPLAQRDFLDRTARRRALALASLPEDRRLARNEGLERDLRESGCPDFRRATEFVDVQRGYEDAAASILSRWQGYGAGWSVALDRDWTAVGVGTAEADDGGLVFVAVFVQQHGALPDLGEIERRTVEAINEIRLARGLPALEFSRRLASVARQHSKAMVRRSFFGHRSPDGDGPADRVRGAGLGYRRVAENVARNRGADDPVIAAVDGWKDSPGHRENMLDPEVTQTGVGVAVAEDRTFYFTQLFLLPADRP